MKSKLVTSKIEVLTWHDPKVRVPDNVRRVMVTRQYGTIEFGVWEKKENMWTMLGHYQLLPNEVSAWCEVPEGKSFR